jgi:hypothetical protein
MTAVSRRPSAAVLVLCLLADLVLVVAFGAIGYATHHGGIDAAGLIRTTWPFAVALLLGWIVLVGWRDPRKPLRAGLPLWAITAIGGLVLRMVTSGTVPEIAFVIVTAVVLFAFLVGWRAVAALVLRLRSSRAR